VRPNAIKQPDDIAAYVIQCHDGDAFAAVERNLPSAKSAIHRHRSHGPGIYMRMDATPVRREFSPWTIYKRVTFMELFRFATLDSHALYPSYIVADPFSVAVYTREDAVPVNPCIKVF